MNRERQKALGNMFFDVAKYLLTSAAIGSFVVQNVNLVAFAVSIITSIIIAIIAYYITPQDKED